jgi:aspartate kinase
MRRVIKFGGTSLATPAHFARSAKAVAGLVEAGEQIAVVVSAMGDETDRLIADIANGSSNLADPETILRYVSTGEEKSVLMMTAALRAYKMGTAAFHPKDTNTWPLIIDSDDTSPLSPLKTNEERDFTVRSQKTSNRFMKHVLPHLRMGKVPVIAGFIALSSRDELVALGRGGSDITAFLTGRYIDADEVIIVTDVEGILTADPSLANNPRILENLTVEEAEAIAKTGARVLHPRAFRFMSADMRVRVMDHRKLDELIKAGTTITGESKTTIYRNESRLASLVLVGSGWANRPGILGKLAGILAENNIPISGATSGSRFIVFYVAEDIAEQAHSLLHDTVASEPETFTNISLRGGIGEIRLRSNEFVDAPGVLAEVARQLAHKGVNVREVVTAVSDIHLYIEWEDMDAAYEALLKFFKSR